MNSTKITKAMKVNILMILAMASTLLLGFYMYQGNTVTLNMDGEVIEVVTYSKTVEEFVESEELNIDEGAYVSMALDTEIKDDIDLTIKNEKKYTLDLNGEIIEIRSPFTKVENILKDTGYELGELDYTLPERSKNVKPNTTIELYRVVEKVEASESEIPFEEQVTMDPNKDRGVINVVQEGKSGLRRQEAKNRYVNGVIISSVVIKDEIVQEPVSKMIEKGSREQVVATSRGNARYKKAVEMTATAYTADYASTGKKPGDKYFGITASGTKARPGSVAVDPRVIPLGTKLYIESLDGTSDYGFAVAEDTGGAIKGNKVDLFFSTRGQCYSFGRRKVKVYVLE